MNFFSFNFPLREYFFLYFARPLKIQDVILGLNEVVGEIEIL